MSRPGQQEHAAELEDLRAAARTLSSMLAAAVDDARQRQNSAPGGERAAASRELKELTGVLKDIAGVVKTLEGDGGEAAATGVVVLPEVMQNES